MSAGKIIGYVVSGLFLFFGVLWLLSAFSAQTLNPGGRLVVGAILVIIGLGLIVIIKLREPKPAQEVRITQEIELSGDIEMEKLVCKQCGAQLDKKSITLAEGAIIISCPYCGVSYQMVEEPKW